MNKMQSPMDSMGSEEFGARPKRGNKVLKTIIVVIIALIVVVGVVKACWMVVDNYSGDAEKHIDKFEDSITKKFRPLNIQMPKGIPIKRVQVFFFVINFPLF